MKAGDHQCPYCHQNFTPSPYRPDQRICSWPKCQRSRKRDYHRRRLASDDEYREVCRDSRRKWRAGHPEYQRQYRRKHPEYQEHNRRQQRRRDQNRRLDGLVKNNLAFDLKRSEHEVWLVAPEAGDLVKNNLAFSQLMIFQKLGDSKEALA